MNRILSNFNKVKEDSKKEFVEQLGQDKDCKELLEIIWEANNKGQDSTWIRSLMIKNFESIITKLNAIGIRVFRCKVEDEYRERLITWSDEAHTKIAEYECK